MSTRLMTRLMGLTAAVACLIPATAMGAITTSDGSDPAPYASLLDHSYMPIPATFTVVPSPGGCPGQVSPGMSRPAACADSDMRMYVDPQRVLMPDATFSASYPRMAITHETGHIVDFTIRAQDGGATDRAFDALMTTAGVAGSRMEQFADTWALCSLEGPTGDTDVFTPSYNFNVPADAYAQACELFRQAQAQYAGFDPATATYTGAPWRMQAHPGDCVSGRYVVTCPQPTPEAVPAAHHRVRPCWRRAYRHHHRRACRSWSARHATRRDAR